VTCHDSALILRLDQPETAVFVEFKQITSHFLLTKKLTGDMLSNQVQGTWYLAPVAFEFPSHGLVCRFKKGQTT